MEINNKIEWSNDVEDFLKGIGERCACMAYLHNEGEKVYSKKAMYIDLPVIIFSTISGSLSLSAERIFGPENEKVASIGCGILSLGVGVLNTINSYFGFARSAENCKQCYIQYSKIYRFICIELKLPRNERVAANDLIRIIQEQYERLSEVGNNVPISVLSKFKKKFHNSEITKPSIANGLDPIIIYGRNRPVEIIISDTAKETTKQIMSAATASASTKTTKHEGKKKSGK